LTCKTLVGLPLITLAPVLKIAGAIASPSHASVEKITQNIENTLAYTEKVTSKYASYFRAREIQRGGRLHEIGFARPPNDHFVDVPEEY